MDKSCLLCQLADLRIDSILDQIACSDEVYQSILQTSKEYAEELEQLDLSEKAKRLIDCHASEQNALGSRYGILAYRLGFSDGMKLILAALQFHS